MPEFLLWMLDKVVLALLVGLIGSAIFFIIISRFKPLIKISPVIVRGVSTKTGGVIYKIKVINMTRDSVVDIKAQLHFMKKHETASGSIFKSDAIELTRSDPLSFEKFDKNAVTTGYAFRFITYEDIETRWVDDEAQFIKFRIYARHAVSGFGNFFSRTYKRKNASIVEGEFSKGNTFEVE